MFRIFSSLMAFVFFIWILPLGAFIKISEEGKVCGGQRAICLCSKNLPKKVNGSSKLMFTGSASLNKEAVSSGGANREFSVEKFFLIMQSRQEDFQLLTFNPTTVLFIKSIEHVPKA